MLRFAETQSRHRAQAEDAVQRALTAALQGRESFASRALRSWVIVKDKIVDALRRRVLQRVAVEVENDADLDAHLNAASTGRTICVCRPGQGLNQ